MSETDKQDKKTLAKTSERTTLAKIKRRIRIRGRRRLRKIKSTTLYLWRKNRALFLLIIYVIYLPLYWLIAPYFLWLLSMNGDPSDFAMNIEQVSKLPPYSPQILLLLLPASYLLWAWRDVDKRKGLAVAQENQRLEIERKRSDDFARIVQNMKTDNDYQKIAAMYAVVSYLDVNYDSHYRKTARSILLGGHRTDVEKWIQRTGRQPTDITPQDVTADSVMHVRQQIIKNSFAQLAAIDKYFSYSDFSGMDLYNMDFLGCYFPNAKFINATLRIANLQGAWLAHADLQGANLEGANIQGAALIEANLQKATLVVANLQRATMLAANLKGAFLEGANLQGVNLWHANLKEAYLGGVDLRGADLMGAKYSKQQLEITKSYRGAKLNPKMDNPPPDEREPPDEDSN